MFSMKTLKSLDAFFQLGIKHGRLSHDYQPVRLPAPLELQKASSLEQTEFWEGWTIGWDAQEASSVIFFKVEA